jgi:hypothetical protein
MNHKTDLEVIEIAHFNNTANQKEIILKARKELEKRNLIRVDNINYIPRNWAKESRKYFLEELARLNKNKNEKYDIYEFLKLIIIYPFLIRYRYYNYKSIITLWNLRYYRKCKQRILTLILSILFYTFLSLGFGSYIINHSNQSLQREMDKIDISDWEKEFGYDK